MRADTETAKNPSAIFFNLRPMFRNRRQ
jgi:hypothetical protein